MQVSQLLSVVYIFLICRCEKYVQYFRIFYNVQQLTCGAFICKKSFLSPLLTPVSPLLTPVEEGSPLLRSDPRPATCCPPPP
jgi:hypothetical protein